jgi:hypothetical protein
MMRRLLTGHAVSFNKRHRRHGHLFQNRYKSILCQEEPYLLELVRYIHLNALRAKVVRGIGELDEYVYSGHSALVGRVERPWQDTGYILGMFGRDEEEARGRYREFVEGGIRGGRKPELAGGGLVRSAGGWSEVRRMRKEGAAPASDERILGDGDFVERVLREAEEEMSRATRLRREGWTLERVVARAAELCGVEIDVIYGGSKARAASRARSLCSYWAVKELGMSAAAVARELGTTRQAASIATRRGEELVRAEGFTLMSTE